MHTQQPNEGTITRKEKIYYSQTPGSSEITKVTSPKTMPTIKAPPKTNSSAKLKNDLQKQFAKEKAPTMLNIVLNRSLINHDSAQTVNTGGAIPSHAAFSLDALPPPPRHMQQINDQMPKLPEKTLSQGN
ncbi:hypothetical protein CHS0354_032550 [Potamilus streckersoni]|uniref:Uncharacterized protein n=1 Tax=Potamilus streckersoni TaxID=2493646 RepID=A0AAE0W0J6_9BIVA|nr:hypothetical protein CHS0354_032550 [Potamilus streckersoni]